MMFPGTYFHIKSRNFSPPHNLLPFKAQNNVVAHVMSEH